MEKWVHENLSTLLDFPVPSDLTQYILQMRNGRDLDEYLRTLLDYDNPRHKQFACELKKRQASSNDTIGYKKSAENDDSNQKQPDKKKGKSKGRESQVAVQESSKPPKVEKKKAKFVKLYAQDGSLGDVILLKGRHKCNCEAKTHALINNCISCGRIVCAQEGAGPCFSCNELVCSPDQQAILSSNSKQADNLYNRLMEQKPKKNLEDVVKHRNKLLEYDRDSARRTEVIDDESDYYQANSVWLSTAEREKLKKLEDEARSLKHGSRLNRKVTLDFAGRQIVDEEEPVDDIQSSMLREFEDPASSTMHTNACPSTDFERPTYVEQNLYQLRPTSTRNSSGTTSRIQDKEYLEMVDEGRCLSMHQPYASLLVAGIKTHEGRTWYSSHRGRLWIAAAAKVPQIEEISTLEHRYRVLKDENIKFPDSYPTGCLLGCVTVVDVLPQEEYRKIYPEGESDSPYVFICEDFYELPIRFPIQGKHKIYKLDSKIHQAAMKSLQKAFKMKALKA